MNQKAGRIRLYYGIFLSVFTIAVGVLFAVQSLRIFFGGGAAQGAYTRQIVEEYLFPVSIPFYIWIAAIVAGYVLSVLFPCAKKTVRKVDERKILKRLRTKLPAERDGFAADFSVIEREEKNRKTVWYVCAAVCFACAVIAAVYLLNPNNFPAESINGDMFRMMLVVLPCVLAAFACCVGATAYETYSARRELVAVKRVIAASRGVRAQEQPVSAWTARRQRVAAALTSGRGLMAIRIGVFALAVVFIVLGICNQGMRDVLIKAINICTECIGLG